MQLKLLVFALLWSLTLGCNSSPPRPHRKENCEYCPECARVSTGQIGGVSNFATITNVSKECTSNFFFFFHSN